MQDPLASAGYVVFNVDYRLSVGTTDNNPWPAQLDDVNAAFRWVQSNATAYGVDPERIGALGHSSGGQLAAFLGTRPISDRGDANPGTFPERVACVVDL
jgi:acetyl esterase/lipase